MRLDHLRLRDFRAHRNTSLRFSPAVNLLFGPNGAGKTNLVEAIGYLGLGRSCVAATDGPAVRRGAAFFEVEGEFTSDSGASVRVRLACVPGEGKRGFVNGAPLDRLADIVGRVPVVILSPADYALTAGGPEERRRFLDTILSQSTPAYLDELLRYRRVLRQRNALLFAGRRAAPSPALGAWDAELVDLGSRVIERRLQFLTSFEPFLDEAFGMLGLEQESAGLRYVSSVTGDAPMERGDIGDSFQSQLTRASPREFARGRTLVGPHLDEVLFFLNGMEVRPFASQGQHRSFGLAMRLASFLFLRDRLDETPILLLDDVFGPLDARRSNTLLNLLASGAIGQSIITAARADPLLNVIDFDSDRHSATEIREGGVASGDSMNE